MPEIPGFIIFVLVVATLGAASGLLMLACGWAWRRLKRRFARPTPVIGSTLRRD